MSHHAQPGAVPAFELVHSCGNYALPFASLAEALAYARNHPMPRHWIILANGPDGPAIVARGTEERRAALTLAKAATLERLARFA